MIWAGYGNILIRHFCQTRAKSFSNTVGMGIRLFTLFDDPIVMLIFWKCLISIVAPVKGLFAFQRVRIARVGAIFCTCAKKIGSQIRT